MDLMTLAAKITLDDSSYTKGISNAEKMGESLAGKMSSMTVAVGNLAADMIKKGVGAVQQVISGAMDGYADYQQLIGGVETLFKSSAGKVANYAKQSFKTTGLSANEYMETVTSFSASLLQGLGGDTEQAADLANTAITDMADNANKMGTDISSIQAAYQGFAKQNYTMLDNLKLGYGGTQSEMVRLMNDSGILNEKIEDLDGITFDQMIAAIHKVQEEMGITGTTAKEAAETISGSKASLTAAWQDLLSAVGGEGDKKRLDETLENFKTSFKAYMENFIPTLVTTIANSGTLVTGIADAIASLPDTLLSDVADAGIEAGTEMIGGVSKITSWLIKSITNMFKSASANPQQIADLGVAIGDFLGTAISDIVKNAPAILEGIVTVGVNLAGGLVEGLFKGLFGEGAEVDKINEELNKELVDIDVNDAKASALLKYIQKLVDQYGKGVTEIDEFKKAQQQLEEVMPGASEIFTKYGENVAGAVTELQALQKEMKATAVRAGLTKALNAQYELLGEQTARKERAEYKAETNRYALEGIQEKVADSLQAYAAEWLRMYENDELPAASQEGYEKAQKLLEGKVWGGEGWVDMSSLPIGELVSQALQYGNVIEQNGEGTPIWDQEYTDNIYSPESLSAFYGETESLQKGITDSLQEADAAQKEIDETNKEIAITEGAIEKAIVEQNAGIKEAMSQLQQGGLDIASAMTWVSQRLYSIWGGGEDAGSHAKGAWSVPYDDYPALLHRGERVLTASQARQDSGGVDLSGMFDIVRSAIQEGMSGVSVNSYLSGRNVTDDVSRNMARELKARRFRS